ncbi:hypothetical protein MLD38_011063 [Melastoma candidum]|uniref:Uncharacterized protein n=1 Tax=Melastoma candidum TaxID=119954 RepID=A0ACB9R1V4_9MYRT|nr:hypothetical protein MLD38_011063 [Melastoma candidum]
MEDDTINLILHGCKLVKDLEVSLPNIANQPALLSKFCEDIIAVFFATKQRIDCQSHCSSGRRLSPYFFDDQQQPHLLKQLLGMGFSPSILIPQSTNMAGTSRGSVTAGSWMERRVAGTDDVTVADATPPGIPTADVSAQERASSIHSKRHRKRNTGEDSWTVKIPVPKIGNVEIPPDDGYTWRKYGQKDILGSKFPRGYYRCTHRKLYRCPAKKQVQRLDSDPSNFEVTYRHLHTCHMSSTAPSVPSPSLPRLISQDNKAHVISGLPSQPPLTSMASSSSMWMPIGFDIGGTSFTQSMNAGGDIACPSAGIGAECRFSSPVGDFVFNHSAVQNNTFEFVVPYMEERWPEGGEQK